VAALVTAKFVSKTASYMYYKLNISPPDKLINPIPTKQGYFLSGYHRMSKNFCDSREKDDKLNY
jgi:hypothetical protein